MAHSKTKSFRCRNEVDYSSVYGLVHTDPYHSAMMWPLLSKLPSLGFLFPSNWCLCPCCQTERLCPHSLEHFHWILYTYYRWHTIWLTGSGLMVDQIFKTKNQSDPVKNIIYRLKSSDVIAGCVTMWSLTIIWVIWLQKLHALTLTTSQLFNKVNVQCQLYH